MVTVQPWKGEDTLSSLMKSLPTLLLIEGKSVAFQLDFVFVVILTSVRESSIFHSSDHLLLMQCFVMI